MAAPIRVGTSGYSFKDWVGTVYPERTPSSGFLSHYARWFDAVEVNSTYYRIPSPTMFEGMLVKVPPDFAFVVKTPKEMTHERAGFDEAVRPFVDGVRPLVEAGQLGGLLAQFPNAFKPSDEHRDHLRRLADALLPVAPLNVEFRHAGWYYEATFALLRDLGLGFVNVDLPQTSTLPPASGRETSAIAYFRFHGRNRAMWWNHPTPSHRYDYLYSATELDEWTPRIESAAEEAGTKTVFAFTNNCHLGKSVVNALQLRKEFGLPAPSLPPGASPDLFEADLAEEIDNLLNRIAVRERSAE